MPRFMHSSLTDRQSLRVLDVRADDTDTSDYIYAPSLTPLPLAVDHSGGVPVLDQGNEGACVGFALATVVYIGLTRRYKALPARKRPKIKPEPVSHRMLYEMGRRYDEWRGTNYEGTSLRGAMKGWHKHGVAADKIWPYYKIRGKKKMPERDFTPARAADAMRRPIGAYYRVIDSDVSHVQAAVIEGDAVLVSAWMHSGWHHDNLKQLRNGSRKVIPPEVGKIGLHAFAIVGYGPEGFIIQNSWGKSWGSDGLAILCYEDWFENRQDAWVARVGPETRSYDGKSRIYVSGFGGGLASQAGRAETSASGLNLDPGVLTRLIDTGDRGQLSTGGRLQTRKAELADMARQVLSSKVLSDGYHHVILYAHGGLNGEEVAANTANRLWKTCEELKLHAYFFIWESGLSEATLGWLKSGDDATGPAGFSWDDAWESIKQGAGKLVRAGQRKMGEQIAPVIRDLWDEMKGRGQGASTSNGGAALFVNELFKSMAELPEEKYKIHLVGHSAGSNYLGWLYGNALKDLFKKTPGNAILGSIQLMAPAITIRQSIQSFGNTAIAREKFCVYMLNTEDEDNDSIVVYPSSLLTYVADCLESDKDRVPVLGMLKDFDDNEVDFATRVVATKSHKHGSFDDENHEVDIIFQEIAAAKF